MINFKEKMDVYIEKNKKNSKLNKTEVEGVVLLLKEEIGENVKFSVSNINAILFDLHYSVTAEFFKNVFFSFDEKVKVDLIANFMHADRIIKNKNNRGIQRSLVIINELLRIGENDMFIHKILKFCAKIFYGKDSGEKAGEQLAEICFEDTKSKLFSLDFSDWDETMLRSLSVWLDKAISYTKDAAIIAEYFAFIKKYNLPITKKREGEKTPLAKPEVVEVKTTQEVELAKNIPKKDHREKIFILASDLQYEIDRIFKEKIKLSKELEEAKSKLEKIKTDKESLLIQLSEETSKNSQQQEQNRIKEIKILDAEKKMAEMDERLEYAYKADKRSGNQELVALKNELIKQLKTDYLAFKKLAAKEPTQYNLYYEGLVGTIENIFDSLRRNGIVMNNENEG